jgi:3'(2'), 5'-bisphosphate nucleotidase
MITDRLLHEIISIALAAGDIIMDIYGGPVEVKTKDDSSPVTLADEAAEKHILAALKALTPNIPVVAEESVAAGAIPDISGGRFWLVDPLDGTKEFISHNGEFTVNIALVINGSPVLGVVHAPAIGRTFYGAKDEGAFCFEDGEAHAIAARPAPTDGVVVVTSRSHGAGEELDAFLSDLKIASTSHAGSSLKFCLVAAGEADVYPRFGRTMEWDTAAGQAVLMAAGGRVDTTAGEPLLYGKEGLENPHFIACGAANP